MPKLMEAVFKAFGEYTGCPIEVDATKYLVDD